MRATPVLIVMMVSAGCGGLGAPTSPAPSTTTAAPLASITAPSPSASSVTAPLPCPEGRRQGNRDPNGPYGHSVWIGKRSGLTITGATRVVEHGSVPDGARLADGGVAIYYVDGVCDAIAWGVWDGSVFTQRGFVSTGEETPHAVDPDVRIGADGTTTLTVFANLGPSAPGVAHDISELRSDDGTVFSAGSEVHHDDEITDPSVVVTADGIELMSVSRGQVTEVLARVTSAESFVDVAAVDGGVGELALGADGSIELITCRRAGMTSWRSTDGGRTWTEVGVLQFPGGLAGGKCDPSVVAGTDWFVWKSIDTPRA